MRLTHPILLHWLDTTPRQSTTAKVTRRHLALITLATQCGEGVIVRLRGKEYGAIMVGRYGRIWTTEGVMLDSRQCTIRKSTVTKLEALYGKVADRWAA